MDVVNKKQTIREQMISSLEAGPTARFVKDPADQSEEVYSHLPFVEKSIRHQKKQIKSPCLLPELRLCIPGSVSEASVQNAGNQELSRLFVIVGG